VFCWQGCHNICVLCVRCNVTDAFGHTCTLTSHQYKVNLGQPKINIGPKVNINLNEVELRTKQLKAIKNYITQSLSIVW
jgi:hypothetical protein